MVEASKRIVGQKLVSRKQPLEATNVKKIMEKIDNGDLGQLQIAALITMGFCAFLKQDIVFDEDHMKIFLEKRKNDQYWEGSWILVAHSGKSTCPVKLLEKFLTEVTEAELELQHSTWIIPEADIKHWP